MAFTQPATFNEPWSDARVSSHLSHQAPRFDETAFNILYTSYKHMRPEDFSRFLPQYVAAGHELNPRNADGVSFIDYISKHVRQSQPFIEAITSYQA